MGGTNLFILGSGSLRRKELLEKVGAKFRVEISSVPEKGYSEGNVKDFVLKLALDKALLVGATNKGDFVLGADTVVFLPKDKKPKDLNIIEFINNTSGGVVLGKPQDSNDSVRMLKTLSLRVHYVITSVSLVNIEKSVQESFFSVTEVNFIDLDDSLIKEYIKTGEGRDKAGSYAIQGMGSVFINSINGSYTNVVGLPISETVILLRKYKLWKPEELGKAL